MPVTKNINDFIRIASMKSHRKSQVQFKSDHLCNRYCGGSHTQTTATQRVAREGHFAEHWGLTIMPALEVEEEEAAQRPLEDVRCFAHPPSPETCPLSISPDLPPAEFPPPAVRKAGSVRSSVRMSQRTASQQSRSGAKPGSRTFSRTKAKVTSEEMPPPADMQQSAMDAAIASEQTTSPSFEAPLPSTPVELGRDDAYPEEGLETFDLYQVDESNYVDEGEVDEMGVAFFDEDFVTEQSLEEVLPISVEQSEGEG